MGGKYGEFQGLNWAPKVQWWKVQWRHLRYFRRGLRFTGPLLGFLSSSCLNPTPSLWEAVGCCFTLAGGACCLWIRPAAPAVCKPTTSCEVHESTGPLKVSSCVQWGEIHLRRIHEYTRSTQMYIEPWVSLNCYVFVLSHHFKGWCGSTQGLLTDMKWDCRAFCHKVRFKERKTSINSIDNRVNICADHCSDLSIYLYS